MQRLSTTRPARPAATEVHPAAPVQDLLARATPADVVSDPFPHLVLRDAVAADLYRALAGTFPSLATLANPADGAAPGSNRRLDCKATELLGHPAIDPLWQRFAAAHLTAGFLGRFLELFAAHLPAAGTGLPAAPRVGIRSRDGHPEHDVLLDFMIAVNTPVVGRSSSVRGAHVDLPNKLFTALFYLRDPHDDSTGGDLELYRLRDDAPRGWRQRQEADTRAVSQIPDRYVDCVRTVRYDSNVCVIFLNGPRAFHGVSPRSVTRFPRRFACAIAQVARDQFEISALQEGLS